MNTDTSQVDWAELAPQLADAAPWDRAWYLTIARLRSTGLPTAEDLDAWDRLLDPTDERWLGDRDELFRLSARSAHLGVHP